MKDWISVYIQVNTKPAGKKRLGISSVSWNIGKEEPISIADLAVKLVLIVFEMHINVIGIEGIQEQIDKVKDELSQLRMVEKETE